MKYPIVFCDYDATIFDAAAGEVPAKTRKAIFDYTQAGGVFVVATGRMYKSIVKQLAKIDLHPDYLVCLQGSVGYDFRTDREVFCHDLLAEDWRRLAQFAEQRGWVFQAYHGTDVYTAYANPYSDEYFAYTEIEGVVVGEPISRWKEAEGWDMHKIIVMSPADETPQRLACLRQNFAHLDITCSNPRYIEIVSAASGKGNALKAMCRYLGVDPACAAAFGDERNDISLIEAAGLGVAVANAVPELLASADAVCPSCAEGGVGDVLNAIVKGDDYAGVGIR